MHDETPSVELGKLGESAGTEPAWVGDVLHFWFRELSESQWWEQDEAIDALVRERFLALHARLSAHHASERFTTSRQLLAAVIVLDQFSRHLFRRTARAYASDPLARRIARCAVDAKLDSSLTALERQFLYLPFQHSEDAADQRLSVQLFESIGNEGWTRDAIEHREIVERFGRFPHRNAVLGRESTVEEDELLKAPASWF